MREWIITGAFFAALGILIGAFGAHGLKTKISSENLIVFEIGVRYHIYHAVGLILLGIIGFHYPNELINISAYMFCLGIILFSGSLYLLAFTNLRWLGAITPIGGFCFILGWLILAFKIYRS